MKILILVTYIINLLILELNNYLFNLIIIIPIENILMPNENIPNENKSYLIILF